MAAMMASICYLLPSRPLSSVNGKQLSTAVIAGAALAAEAHIATAALAATSGIVAVARGKGTIASGKTGEAAAGSAGADAAPAAVAAAAHTAVPTKVWIEEVGRGAPG